MKIIYLKLNDREAEALQVIMAQYKPEDRKTQSDVLREVIIKEAEQAKRNNIMAS